MSRFKGPQYCSYHIHTVIQVEGYFVVRRGPGQFGGNRSGNAVGISLQFLISEGFVLTFYCDLLRVLFNYVFKFTGDIGLTEDVVQESFLRLYRSAESMHSNSHVRAYIYRIARNLCIDRSRKNDMNFQEAFSKGVDLKTPFDELALKEEEQVLFTAILALPENQKTALLLRHTEGLTYKEISTVMSTSVSSVESLLVRARKKLRIMIDKG